MLLIFVEVEPNRFNVAVTVHSDIDVLELALDEIGCTKEITCVVWKFGDLFVVEKYPN